MRVIALAAVLVSVSWSTPLLDSSLDSEWETFKITYHKAYKGLSVELTRRLNWEEHKAQIAKHNKEYDAGLQSYSMGVNKYSDMSPEEFQSTMTGLRYNASRPFKNRHLPEVQEVALPVSVDWRQHGAVTSVKDQMQCGSPWAFSAIGSLEGQHALKSASHKLVTLSAQQLVDCSKKNNGCEGGFMDYAFDYIQRQGGIDTEESYPYKGKEGPCKYNKTNNAATVSGVFDLQKNSEMSLMAAVASYGPVAVAMDASSISFMRYHSGVYDNPQCSSTDLNHAGVVVGYGTENGKAYWLVKNSWGTTWGDKGYIKMSKDKNNQCGIAALGSLPMV